jgi:TPR repeat protein
MRALFLALACGLLLAPPLHADEVGPGRSTSKLSPEQLAEHYRSRAEAGDPDAQSRLGILYRSGRGVAQSDAEALRWIRQAAEAGHPAAQHYLGLFYLSGVGTEVDLAEAGLWLRRCADFDEPDALLALAWFAWGENGVPGFAEETTALLRNSAELGLSGAEYTARLLQGERLQSRAADKQVGESGIDWLRQSAEGGHREAQYQLALALQTGVGVAAAPAEALGWFELAASQGDPRAMRRLGICHLTGRGVRPDRAAAYRWFWLAERHGDALAKQDVLHSGALLSDALRHRARAEGRAWEERLALER